MGLFGSFLGGPTKPKTSAFNKYKRFGKSSFERTIKKGGLKFEDRKEIEETLGKDYFHGGRQRSYKQIEDDLKNGKLKRLVLERSKKAVKKVFEPKAAGLTEKQIRRNVVTGRTVANQVDNKKQVKNVLSGTGENSSRLGIAGEKYKSGGIASREVSTQDLRGEGKNKNVSIGQKSVSVAGGFGVANKSSSAKPDNVIKGKFLE